MAIEPFFQYRSDGTTYRRKGTLLPAPHLLGRFNDPVTTISNPAYLQITPAFETDGSPLDVKRGDLFVRLKNLNGTATTDEEAIEHVQRTRVKDSFEAHHAENRFNMLRILGDLT